MPGAYSWTGGLSIMNPPTGVGIGGRSLQDGPNTACIPRGETEQRTTAGTPAGAARIVGASPRPNHPSPPGRASLERIPDRLECQPPGVVGDGQPAEDLRGDLPGG